MPPFTGLDPTSASDNLALVRSLINRHPLQKQLNAEQEYQRYHAAGRFANEKMRTTKGGTKLTETIILRNDGTADRVLPYEEVEVDFVDNAYEMEVKWARYHDATAIDDEDLDANTEDAMTVKLLDMNQQRRLPMLRSIMRTLEDDMFGSPSSSDTTRYLLGLDYWLPLAPAGTTSAGFNSDAATIGSTTTNTIGGIDQTDADTNGLWKSFNYPIAAGAVDDPDAWSTAFRHTYEEQDFKVGSRLNSLQEQTGQMYEIYTGIENILRFERFARLAGSETGFHIMDGGQLAYNQVPIYRANPYDGNANSVVKFVNWENFDFYTREGWWFKEYLGNDSANRPTVGINHVYTHCQLRCRARRRAGGNIHTVVSA